MTALTLKIIVAILISLGIFFIGVGIYANDFIYMLIGGLLLFAALLVIPEVNRIHRHPFR